ncbi:MAG: alanyl-tRNA editing protein [Candidatus Hodarchaeales archaeon]|jgi:misacylated tRNA(Ala) deacylase
MVKTVLLYQQDSYLKNARSKLIAKDSKRRCLEFDKTIFYPGGGGQPADQGRINGHSIDSIFLEDQRILHQVNPDTFSHLMKAREMLLEIDWKFRYAIMRLHTAQHLLASVIISKFDTRLAGNHINQGNSHMDIHIERNFTGEECRVIQEEVNKIIAQDLPIVTSFITIEEAKEILNSNRTRMDRLPATLTRLRVVKIKEIDTTACGGTHVKKTSEIGEFKIKKFKSKGKKRKRFYYDIQD